jgi:lysophospholipase L1-like esterase
MRLFILFILISLTASSQTETGVVLNQTSFPNTNGFTVSSGTTASISNNHILLSGGSSFSDASKYLQYDGFIDCDEKIVITVEFILNAAGNGLGIRKKTVNTWNIQDLEGVANLSTGKAEIWNNNISTTTPLAVAGTSVAITIGSSYRYTLTIAKKTVTSSLSNLTAGTTSSTTLETYRYNTSKIQILNFGGTQEITAFKVERKSLKNADIICFGDSKTEGAGASDVAHRFTDLLATSLGRTVETWAGAGDRTVELINNVSYIVAAAPKKVIICMGRNDLASGVSSAMWQTNLSTTRTSLINAGIQVIWLTYIPEPSQDQTSLVNYINTTFGSDTRIDISSGWNNSAMISGDGIHPNDAGHSYIASSLASNSTVNTFSTNTTTSTVTLKSKKLVVQ